MKTKFSIALAVFLAFSTPVLADLTPVEIDQKHGFINQTGKLVIPAKYDFDNIWSFSNGLARVKINGKYGFINKTGTVVFNETQESKKPKPNAKNRKN